MTYKWVKLNLLFLKYIDDLSYICNINHQHYSIKGEIVHILGIKKTNYEIIKWEICFI